MKRQGMVHIRIHFWKALEVQSFGSYDQRKNENPGWVLRNERLAALPEKDALSLPAACQPCRLPWWSLGVPDGLEAA